MKQGAKWPEHHGSLVNEEQSLADRIQRWWAAQPLDPSLPEAARAASNSNQVIDHYVDRKLADVGLQRSPATDRARLVRRLSYDLLGLPPSLEMIERFEDDNRPGAYRRLVSDLFASQLMANAWRDFGWTWCGMRIQTAGGQMLFDLRLGIIGSLWWTLSTTPCLMINL